jgi:hypothetical protein
MTCSGTDGGGADDRDPGRGKQFRSLHEAPEAFVIANVWDGGSARMMAALGFPALATSSGASAGLLGRMMAANYRHIGGLENRLGRHYSRFSVFWPAARLADRSLGQRKSRNGGSNRRT